MANRYRGEAILKDGADTYTLRLSLDALARLEPHLQAATLADMTGTLLGGDLTPAQMRAVLIEALIAGGDTDPAGAEALLAKIGRPLSLRRAYVDLMRATFAP